MSYLNNNNKQKLVMIGNGMAGAKVIEELIKTSPDLYDITVFGSEPYGNYNRIMLSPVLSDEKSFDDIIINDIAWYAENNIDLHTGKTITCIDRKNQSVLTEDNQTYKYDRLIIATGSTPFLLPIDGADLEGVIAYRDIADVNYMIETAGQYRNAVVIGAGLLGLEAAYGLSRRGMQVSVVHNADIPMNRQLDAYAGQLLKKSLESKNINFLMSKKTQSFQADNNTGRVSKVCFADGTAIETDLVVMAIGIVPNIRLAKDAGLKCGRGVVVNDYLQTNDPKVFSVGECVQHRDQTYGLVAPLFEQAKVCANYLSAGKAEAYTGSVVSTKLKVTGIDVFSAGEFIESATDEVLVYKDPSIGIYKKLVLCEEKIKGVVLYGDITDAAWYFDLLKQQRNISDIRDILLFGKAFYAEPKQAVTEEIAVASEMKMADANLVSAVAN